MSITGIVHGLTLCVVMTDKGFYLAPVIPAQHTLWCIIIMHVCLWGGGGGVSE